MCACGQRMTRHFPCHFGEDRVLKTEGVILGGEVADVVLPREGFKHIRPVPSH